MKSSIAPNRSHFASTLVVALALLLLAQAARAALPVMTAASYVERVRQAAAAVDADRATGSITAPILMKPLARVVVRDLAGKSRVFVDNRPLTADLKAAEATSGAARAPLLLKCRQKLTLIADGTSAASPTAADIAHGDSEARALLATTQFGSDPIPPPGNMEKLGKAISDWWNRITGRFHTPTSSVSLPAVDPKVPFGLAIAVGIIAAGIAIYYIVGLFRDRAPNARRLRAESGFAINAEEAELVATRNFDRLMDLARQRDAEGEHRHAFRLVYVAALVALETEGIVRLNRAFTNWEYLRALRGGQYAHLHTLLLPLTRDFDRIWYGFEPAGNPDYERAVEQYNQLRRAAVPVPAPPA